MRIRKIEIEGFKGYKDLQRFTLGDLTRISGENFIGKTSIGEAITWAFFGSNLFGNDKADSLLQNNDSKSIYVSVDFIDNGGTEHKLVRQKGKATSIILDGKKVTQAEVIGFTGPKNIFLSVFTNGYFENLAPKDGRALMLEILPPVKHEDIMAKLNRDYHGHIIERRMINPSEFMAERRKDIKEQEAEKQRLEGKLEIYKERAKQKLPVIQEFDSSLLNSYSTEYAKYQGMIHNGTSSEKLIELQGEYSKLIGNPPQPVDIATLQNESTKLIREKARLSGKIKIVDAKSGKCPTCGQTVSDEYIEELKVMAEFDNAQVMAEIKDIDKKIQDIDDRVRYTTQKNEILKSEWKEAIEKIRQEKEALEALEDEAVIEEKLSELKGLIAIEENKKRNIDMQNGGVKRQIQEIEEATKKIDEVKEEIADIDDEIKVANLDIAATQEYQKIRSELSMEITKLYLDRVSIKLEKLVASTGEYKECFELLYDDKEVLLLSRSERMRMSLEIASLINGMTRLDIPIFLDNKESITHYNRPQCQVIESMVVEGQELKVEVL